jgi:hypothetical protein
MAMSMGWRWHLGVTTMTDISDNAYRQLVTIGLKDPFIRQIAGAVALAFTASAVIYVAGSGINAILSVALLLSFGVIFVILRTLMNNMDTSFVRTACFVASSIIMGIFLVFGVLLIPAATICLPKNFAVLLGLNSCTTTKEEIVFRPVSFPNIVYNPANGSRSVVVFYRPKRLEDAERVVGALLSAGYRSDGVASDLLELTPPSPGATVLRWTASAESALAAVSELIRTAMPVKASSLSVKTTPSSFSRGELQIDLF